MSDLRQREPRVECPAFLAFVRRRPCCACGAPAPSQAAHVRMGEPSIGKRSVGLGEKPSDRWAVPLCVDCHLDSPDAQHRIGERTFWATAKLDPFKIAARLYAQFERRRKRTPEQREKVVRRARRILRKRKPMMEPGVEAEFAVTRGVVRKVSRAKDPELYRYGWGKGRKFQSQSRWPKGRKIRSRR